MQQTRFHVSLRDNVEALMTRLASSEQPNTRLPLHRTQHDLWIQEPFRWIIDNFPLHYITSFHHTTDGSEFSGWMMNIIRGLHNTTESATHEFRTAIFYDDGHYFDLQFFIMFPSPTQSCLTFFSHSFSLADISSSSRHLERRQSKQRGGKFSPQKNQQFFALIALSLISAHAGTHKFSTCHVKVLAVCWDSSFCLVHSSILLHLQPFLPLHRMNSFPLFIRKKSSFAPGFFWFSTEPHVFFGRLS